MPVDMATAKTTSIRKLRKRAIKKTRKLTKKARKLAMRARVSAAEPGSKKRKGSKGKKGHRSAVPG
jgi:hypothetical protein